MSDGLFNIFKEAGKAFLKELIVPEKGARRTSRNTRTATTKTAARTAGAPKLPTRKKTSRPIDSVEFKEYKRNPHAKLKGSENVGIYTLDYTFKDHKNKKQHFVMSYRMKDIKEMTHQFGFPRAFTGSFRMKKAELARWQKMRDQALLEGLFMVNGKNLRPNPSSIVTFYSRIFCEQIAKQIVELLNAYGTDTERERIELAMKFVQDIPYAIPYQNDPDFLYGGVVTPPQILYLKKGDCDSKSFLFAGILTFLIDWRKIAFITVPGHLLAAVHTQPDKGMAVVEYKKKPYVVAETAGPGRNNLGVKAKYKAGNVSLEKLNYRGKNQQPIPYGNSAATLDKRYNVYRAPRTQTDRDLVRAMHTLSKKRKKVKSMVFSDEGAWLILTGKNEITHKNMPGDLLNSLAHLKAKKFEITDIALSPTGEHFITYHKGFGISTSLSESNSNKLLEATNTISEKQGQPIKDIAFTHHSNLGWVAIYGRNNNGFTCNVNQKTLDKMKPAISKIYKHGIKSISFTPAGGWAIIFGKNRMAALLPKKLNEELVGVVKDLGKRKAEINKLYFTPTGDWIVVFNDFRYLTSLNE